MWYKLQFAAIDSCLSLGEALIFGLMFYRVFRPSESAENRQLAEKTKELDHLEEPVAVEVVWKEKKN